MDEYIKREAALNAISRGLGCGNICSQSIRRIPSADVAPAVHGRWIKTEKENGCAEWTEFECSFCGAVFNGNEWLFDEWKGCPVCLARMDGEDNG